MAKKTAGEKFMADLTNAELKWMGRTSGVIVDKWGEGEISQIEMQAVTLVTASKRLSLKDGNKALSYEEVDQMTPTQTQDALVEILGKLGYEDDEDEDFTETASAEN